MGIKVKVLCVFLHDERILVEEKFSKRRQMTIYRPVGGSIEVGEHSVDALVREMREELGADITLPEFLGVIESPDPEKHEVFFIYNARFVEPSFYKKEIVAQEADGEMFTAVWKPLSFFITEKGHLHPDGLLKLLLK